MKIQARHELGVTIIEPKGKITIGEGDVVLRNAVHGALRIYDTTDLIGLLDKRVTIEK